MTLNLPKKIPIFPLPNFIIFPQTTVPLNIFEPRYIEMFDDSMKSNKIIGLIQPKKNNGVLPDDLYDVGCLGKITSFKDTSKGNYLIELNGLARFKITKEIKNNKPYRECEVSFEEYKNDLSLQKETLKFQNPKPKTNNKRSRVFSRPAAARPPPQTCLG